MLIKASPNTNTVHMKHQEIMHLILFTSAHLMIMCYLHLAQAVRIGIIRNLPECTPFKIQCYSRSTQHSHREFSYRIKSRDLIWKP